MDANKITENLLQRIAVLEDTVASVAGTLGAIDRRKFPRQKQAAVQYGLTRALVVSTHDPLGMNRVQYFHPGLDDPKARKEGLKFAAPISAMGGFDDCGLTWVPPAGSIVMLLFEAGMPDRAYYIGTVWNRNRGEGGRDIHSIFPVQEFIDVHQGHRRGFLLGPNDESQVCPPWNTESYNMGDIYDKQRRSNDPEEPNKSTIAHIYGFKTPQKHMVKMVDGNPKCGNANKRLEIMSGGGNWMIFKDDHLHHGGQWSHPDYGGNGEPFISNCWEGQSATDIFGKPVENTSCKEKVSNNSILGGHPNRPSDSEEDKQQTGSNKFFKNQNETRPYVGPQNPQNNKCDLPQAGIQFLSISGHTWVMDDSVDQPRGDIEWETSTKAFDYGCNDRYVGRTYWRSSTGHEVSLSDHESETGLRSDKNMIRIRSASGNSIELNDETIGSGKGCPTDYAGEKRGIRMRSTSNHLFEMIDHMNLQCSPTRRSGGVPTSKASKALVRIRSGGGLEFVLSDDGSQEETGNQFIQLVHPQCIGAETDEKCNASNKEGSRGPHVLKFQGRPYGEPGTVFLRAGGHSVRQTYDMDVVYVGDKERNPSDKYTYVSRHNFSNTEGYEFKSADTFHIQAKNQILLFAGEDCPPAPKKKCKGSCVYGVVIARCPIFCPLTGILHWSDKSVSERVFASGYHPCAAGCGGGDACVEYEQGMANGQNSPCQEDPEEVVVNAENALDNANA